MLDLSRKVLFIHIPKCAGSYIEAHYTPDIDWHNEGNKHLSLSESIELYGKEQIGDCYRFAVVRNPYSRFVSFFNYHKRHKHDLFKDKGIYPNLHSQSYYSDIETFTRTIAKRHARLHQWVINDMRPSAEFCESYSGIALNDIFYFEALSSELEKIPETFKVDFGEEKVNASPKPALSSENKNQLVLSFVKDYYATDIAKFDYLVDELS